MTRACLRAVRHILYRWNRIEQKLRSAYWKGLIESQGGRVDRDFQVKRGAMISFDSSSKLELGESVTLAEGAMIFVGPGATLKLGNRVFIGRGTTLAANKEIGIGSGSQIAHLSTLIDTDHKFDNSSRGLADQGQNCAPIHIGSEVWIGAGSIVLKGRKIGDHAVIGAGSIVTHDVGAGAVVAGNPARELGAPITSELSRTR